MPIRQRATLIESGILEPRALAKKANTLMKAERVQNGQLAHPPINQVQEPSPLGDTDADEQDQVAAINRQSFKSGPKHKKKLPWCRYHAKFGARAFNCEKPCGFQKSAPTTASENSSAFRRAGRREV